MAICDSQGNAVNINDRLRASDGTVFEVCGFLLNEHKMFHARDVTLVPKNTPLTSEKHEENKNKADQVAKGLGLKGAVSGGQSDDDSIFWGT